MTIKEYAKSRGVSYDRTYRATKAIGKERGRNWRPTDLTDEEVAKLDGLLGTPKRKATSAQEFEAMRKGWIETWADAIVKAPTMVELVQRAAVFGTIGYIRTFRGFLDQDVDGRRVGDLILGICYVTKVDFGADKSTSGFTAWLAAEGYTLTKGV